MGRVSFSDPGPWYPIRGLKITLIEGGWRVEDQWGFLLWTDDPNILLTVIEKESNGTGKINGVETLHYFAGAREHFIPGSALAAYERRMEWIKSGRSYPGASAFIEPEKKTTPASNLSATALLDLLGLGKREP